ncbi:ATP-binding protein [Pontixanthobacter sp.]|uniref:ATP-binding protein n=1 Tax=Pontixanthobacter sp. TaxID=2792078 RepID=UPI003C7CEA18
MGNTESTIPAAGIALALLSVIGLMAVGTDIFLAIAVCIIWVGTLFLARARPPAPPAKPEYNPYSSGNMKPLLEYSGTPVLVTENGRVSVANRSARKLLGKHIVGQDIRMVFRQPKAIKLLEKKKGGITTVTGLVRRKDIWRLNRQVLQNGLSIVELINLTAEADISRAHTDFVANASHELRTPLASVIGYVETLQEDAGVPEETRSKFLGTIHSEAQRMQHLVSDLISLSRIEASKHEQPDLPIALRPLIEKAAHDAAGFRRADRLDLRILHDLTVQGDDRQLEQVVRNLVDNALKYGDPAGRVIVSLTETINDEARLDIIDTGDGIPDEHIPHLTRRFYRTDPGRSRASGGTGLGLAIVKHIVERHRGRLDITSRVGQGTTVSVRLPALKGKS